MFDGPLDEAQAHYERGNYPLALEKFQALLNKKPANPHLQYYVGSVFLAMGQNGVAANMLLNATRGKPNFIAAMTNLGVALRNENLIDEAAAAWEEAIKIETDPEKLCGIMTNMGSLYVNNGTPDKALSWYRKALSHNPGDPYALCNMSLALLESGLWAEGWDAYEQGFKCAPPKRLMKDYGLPPWKGEPDQTVIVCGEQGIGDEIMFASMLPDLEKISKKVILDCHPRLATLFKRGFPNIDVYPNRKGAEIGWAKSYPGARQIPIGSLGKYFRRNIKDFPKTPYLTAGEVEKTGGIGIAWEGGTPKTNQADRSLKLSDFEPILKACPGKKFYSLQYTAEAARDVCQFEGDTGITVHHWPKQVECFDYDITAKFVAGLDRVVTVCTTIYHLAGALGIPTLCLTPSKVAWRYGLSGEGNPWYGSNKCIRQEKAGDWKPVIARVVEELTK